MIFFKFSRQAPAAARLVRRCTAALRRYRMVASVLAPFSANCVAALFMLLLSYSQTPVFADVLPDTADVIPQDSVSSNSGTVPDDPSKTIGDSTALESRRVTPASENNELINIVPTTKKLRIYGWGEYQVGGRCLCCDNMLDGDCIIVHNTNITEKKPIKQIVDGTIEGDTSDITTFFGDIVERERPDHVSVLMADISLNKLYDIYEVIVYTIPGSVKKSFLTNCELGYYDQFDRLLWAGKAENKKGNDRIIFKLKRPVLTKNLLLKVKDGKNRITEVGIFCKKNSQ